MSSLNIAIAGCGIGGLASALLLHRQGHAVTLYDRFAEPRPLGSGLMLQPTGLAVLDRLGLAEEIVRHGAAVTRLFGRNDQGAVVLDARYGDLARGDIFGLGIHRASLFGALYDAVRGAGIAVETGRTIAGTELAGGAGRRLVFEDREASGAFDLVIDAMGVGSPLVPAREAWLPFGALWTSLEWPEGGPFDPALLEQRYEAASGMLGILPTGCRRDGGRRELALFWSLRAADYPRWLDAGLDRWKAELCAMWPACEALDGQLRDPAQMVIARYAHRTSAHPAGERIVHIGDAWHAASPQLGQGANMALLDAWALASALGTAPSLEAGLRRAVALRRGHVRLYQALTAGLTPLYQSDSLWPVVLRDLLLAPLSRIGPGPRIQAALVGGLAGAPLGRLGLSFPDYTALRPMLAMPR